MSNCKLCLADCAFSRKDMKKGTCKGYIPMTNSDRIRAMSDEELADMFAQFAEENPSDDAGAWLDWLIKPTEEG